MEVVENASKTQDLMLHTITSPLQFECGGVTETLTGSWLDEILPQGELATTFDLFSSCSSTKGKPTVTKYFNPLTSREETAKLEVSLSGNPAEEACLFDKTNYNTSESAKFI